ncbi:hypothetical protein VNO77_16143 [Canavalia gladiata]|uniref:Uncharacterized protein n=1 Tax=Canavalia gladiata TaxID=3824 RepID=A0AAN9M509_CANGL
MQRCQKMSSYARIRYYVASVTHDHDIAYQHLMKETSFHGCHEQYLVLSFASQVHHTPNFFCTYEAYTYIDWASRKSFMAVEESNTSQSNHQQQQVCDPCKSFGKKCSHLVKKQRAKFYILRRCIAMLLCWHEH